MRHAVRPVALAIVLVLVPARVPADGGSQRSIILFRNQHPEAPASRATATLRATTIDADQAEVASTLARGGARDVRRGRSISPRRRSPSTTFRRPGRPVSPPGSLSP